MSSSEQLRNEIYSCDFLISVVLEILGCGREVVERMDYGYLHVGVNLHRVWRW
jgi:hypothetical protein